MHEEAIQLILRKNHEMKTFSQSFMYFLWTVENTNYAKILKVTNSGLNAF
jgi:hypothetical protein